MASRSHDTQQRTGAVSMRFWSDDFVGIPYADRGRVREGCDCWGLVCVTYREELGITLPDYLGYRSTDELGEVATVIAGATASPLWVPVNGMAVAFDVAVFRRGIMDAHIGIVVHHGLMLHLGRDDCAKLESYKGGAWSHRLTGHFRHVDMVSRAAR